MLFLQRYYVSSMRQLRRLNSASKSPIFSHFGETLTGVTTIRAFGAESRFIDDMNKKIDENLIYFYPDSVSNRWLGVRLEFIGSLITLFASLFAVIGRNSLTGGAAGLSISYSLNVFNFCFICSIYLFDIFNYFKSKFLIRCRKRLIGWLE